MSRASVQRTRGLFDFLVAGVCLWAAYFHTPAGALVRQVGALLLGGHSTAQPLLSYFRTAPSGGALWAGRSIPAVPSAIRAPSSAPVSHVGAPVPLEEALGLAVSGTLADLSSSERRFALAQAKAESVDPEALTDPRRAGAAVLRVLTPMTRRLGGTEPAVLALFVDEDRVRFAAERAQAGGETLQVEALARHLPESDRTAADHAAAALALATAYRLRWPLPESARVTSPFGWRPHPVLGALKRHEGVDVSVPIGTEVWGTGAGQVRRASEDALNGKMVVIDHGHGVSTLYCHNAALRVRRGDVVRVGQVIALSGASGRVTGPHLHYQIELSDVPVDPLRLRRRPR